MRMPFNQPRRSPPAAIGGSAVLLAIGGALALATESWRAGAAFALGAVGGALLCHTGFAFVAGWRGALARREMAGVEAQIAMLGAGVLLFAATLARGAALGQPVQGAAAPLGVSVALGGALFGLGLALVEGGLALVAALGAAVAGAVLAGLAAPFWAALPALDPVVLPTLVRWQGAAPIQLGVLILLWTAARVRAGDTPQPPVRPLIAPALALAVTGWAILAVTGHPWALVPGAASWTGGAPVVAIWRMDLAVALGAVAFAALAGGLARGVPAGRTLLVSVAGGLVLGAGCGIAGDPLGALVAPVASASLSGWLWLACAVGGTACGLRLRRTLDAPG